MPSTPADEIHGRIQHLQDRLERTGMDGALIVQRIDLYYFAGTAQDAHLFVPRQGTPCLMVRRDRQRAEQDTPLQDVRGIRRLSDVGEILLNVHREPISKLGLELDVLPANNYFAYKKLFPEGDLVDVSPLIRETRMVKSPYELELMGKAAGMTAELFGMVPHILKEGMTELEFSGLLEAEFRKRGHQGLVSVRSFNVDCFYGHIMSGPNLAVPGVSPGPTGGPGPNPSFPQGAGHRAIQRHEPISIDYVGVADGYLVDQARTFYIGDPPAKFVRIHETALSIQEAVQQAGVPGARAEDLYSLAVEMARDAGLEEGFMGYPQPVAFVGHGVGLELDELPVLGRRSATILENNMTIALEPKFIIPNEGLAGIENTFVVREHGLERLTHFPDDLHIVD